MYLVLVLDVVIVYLMVILSTRTWSCVKFQLQAVDACLTYVHALDVRLRRASG